MDCKMDVENKYDVKVSAASPKVLCKPSQRQHTTIRYEEQLWARQYKFISRPCKFSEKCQRIRTLTCTFVHGKQLISYYLERLPATSQPKTIKAAEMYLTRYAKDLLPRFHERFPKVKVQSHERYKLTTKPAAVTVQETPCRYGKTCRELPLLQCRYKHTDEHVLGLRWTHAKLARHGRNYFQGRWKLWLTLADRYIREHDDRSWDETLRHEYEHEQKGARVYRPHHVIRFMVLSMHKITGKSSTWFLLPEIRSIILEYLGLVTNDVALPPPMTAMHPCDHCNKPRLAIACVRCRQENVEVATLDGCPFCHKCLWERGFYADVQDEKSDNAKTLPGDLVRQWRAEATLSVNQQQQAPGQRQQHDERSLLIEMYGLKPISMVKLNPSRYCAYANRHEYPYVQASALVNQKRHTYTWADASLHDRRSKINECISCLSKMTRANTLAVPVGSDDLAGIVLVCDDVDCVRIAGLEPFVGKSTKLA